MSGPHSFYYYIKVKSKTDCDFTFYSAHSSHNNHRDYEYISKNGKFFIKRKIDKELYIYNNSNSSKQNIIDTSTPANGSVFIITDCSYPFTLSLNVDEYLQNNPDNTVNIFNNLKNEGRVLQLDDGDEDDDDLDDKTVTKKNLYTAKILIDINYDMNNKEVDNDENLSLPNGNSEESLNALKINVLDKKLQME